MSHSVALNDVKRDVKSQGLEDFPSKPFFLTVKKKHLSNDEFNNLFQKAFPGWDKVNGDEYHINHCQIQIPDAPTHEYETELNQMIAWMEAHLKGSFHIAGIHYPKKATVQFQFLDDMKQAQKRFNG